MSTAEAHLDVPTSVDLPPGSKVQLSMPGEPAEDLDPATVARLFAIGLRFGRGDRPSSTKAALELPLLLHGPVRFLVGSMDVGPKRGLRAVRDGLERSFRVIAEIDGSATTRGPDESAEPADRDAPRTAPTEMFVDVDRAGADFTDLVDKVRSGTRVVLTERGEPRAVMIDWGAYCDLNYRLARVQAGYWSAWRRGRFDADAFSEVVDDLLRPSPTEVRPPTAGSDQASSVDR